MNEAKLLVVGNEAVGKTSLVRFLTTGMTRDPSEPPTRGAGIRERIETLTWRDEGTSIQLNVWDFGGQEIMHGTHRFFLSERSLYLLVLEARREDDDSVFNWLKTIRNRGGDSPVIVVINKCDEGSHNLRLDVTALQRDYPNIVEVLPTSCEDNDFARRSIAVLRRLIAETLASHSRMGHVRDEIPGTWLRIKSAVADLARKESLLESQRFVALCSRGKGRDRVTDPSEQSALLRLLHDLGVVVAHGLDRDAPAALREVTLLDPNWLTGAIYAVLNEPQVLRQEGEFFREQLPLWLDSKRYPPRRHEYILDMMQSQDLGLCFRLPTEGDQERYLLPEALSSTEPDYGTWPSDSLRFRYEYDYLPPGLIPRLIVIAHRNLTAKPTRWRTGAVLAVDSCPVLIKGDRDRRRIDISVTGPTGQRRSALGVVREYFSVVHQLNQEADPRARVPLPDDSENSVGYDHLIEMEERKGGEYSYFPEGAGREYTVNELLHGIATEARVPQLPEADPSESPPLGSPAEALSWTPEQAIRLGVFMLGSLVLLVSVFLMAERIGGATVAGGVTAAALSVVLAIGAFVLRSSGRMSEGSLIEVLERILRKN